METKNKETVSVTEISRSQASQLIELLSPMVDEAFMKRIINERLEKYQKWSKDSSKIRERLIPKEVFEKLKEALEQEGISEARQIIQQIIDDFKLAEWERTKGKVIEKFRKTAKERGYIDE